VVWSARSSRAHLLQIGVRGRDAIILGVEKKSAAKLQVLAPAFPPLR
jgi:hypothetical protein